MADPVAIAEAASAAAVAAAAAAAAAVSHPGGETNQQQAGGGGVARGALIVLEGLDRSGKTTQVKLLEQRFVELGRKVKVMRFPGKRCRLLVHACIPSFKRQLETRCCCMVLREKQE
jgi:dTMP kinase